jgi:hypothetical protein
MPKPSEVTSHVRGDIRSVYSCSPRPRTRKPCTFCSRNHPRVTARALARGLEERAPSVSSCHSSHRPVPSAHPFLLSLAMATLPTTPPSGATDASANNNLDWSYHTGTPRAAAAARCCGTVGSTVAPGRQHNVVRPLIATPWASITVRHKTTAAQIPPPAYDATAARVGMPHDFCSDSFCSAIRPHLRPSNGPATAPTGTTAAAGRPVADAAKEVVPERRPPAVGVAEGVAAAWSRRRAHATAAAAEAAAAVVVGAVAAEEPVPSREEVHTYDSGLEVAAEAPVLPEGRVRQTPD